MECVQEIMGVAAWGGRICWIDFGAAAIGLEVPGFAVRGGMTELGLWSCDLGLFRGGYHLDNR